MSGAKGLLAAMAGGVLTSASPCVLAAVPVVVGFVGGQANSPRRAWALSLAFVAGMNMALLVMGLLAARLGLLMGTLPGPWLVAVGVLVIATVVWLWRSSAASCGVTLPNAMQLRLAQSGIWGTVVLGALISTVMSPCATPALVGALAIAGSGAALGASMGRGAVAGLRPRTQRALAVGRGHALCGDHTFPAILPLGCLVTRAAHVFPSDTAGGFVVGGAWLGLTYYLRRWAASFGELIRLRSYGHQLFRNVHHQRSPACAGRCLAR